MKKQLLYIIPLSVLLLACESDFEIEGTWTVEALGTTGTLPTETDLRDVNIYNFFGVTAWESSEGKTFTFLENDQVKTTIVSSEMLEQWNFQYKWNKDGQLITFRARNPVHKERLLMPQEYELETSDRMVWKLNSFFSATLVRQKN